MIKLKNFFKKSAISLSLGLAVLMMSHGIVSAAPAVSDTGVQTAISASGRYVNWDGVTNVAQFKGNDGNLFFAVDSDSSVTVYKTNSQMQISGTVTLAKQHPIFGTVICDGNGNFYLVTGEANTSDDTSKDTVFISKYDSNGNLIASVGDDGRSSLAFYYDESFNTKTPFNAGNCDATISGDYLTVYYARKMYSGHQSCSAFTVNINDLSKVTFNSAYDGIYESHSFAQRVVPTSEGFAYVSEGDCYSRAFVVNSVKISGNKITVNNEASTFDFWVEDGALDAYNMYVVNANFAHMGGLISLSNGKVAFAAQSVQSLNSNAQNEKEEIFIQIFDPYADLSGASAYTTSGIRSGLAGPNGRDEVTNYGVKWLTNYGTGEVNNVQIATASDNKIVVLYELCNGGYYSSCKGVYYIVLDESGNVVQDSTLYSETARLNPCESPVTVNGNVCWVGNSTDNTNQIYAYCLNLSGSYDDDNGEDDNNNNEENNNNNNQNENNNNNDTPAGFEIFDVPAGCAMQARMYNPNSGEHFYTGSKEEVQNLIDAGWNFEGPGFITPTTGIPIYRLYSDKHGDHFYTTDEAERDALVSEGWKLEGENNGIAFPSADSSVGVPMYRLYNPNAYENGEAGAHHFTTSMQEVHNLEAAGWQYECIAWYSL